MKKHIKKKFLFEIQLTDEEIIEIDATGNTRSFKDLEQIKKVPKDLTAFIITDSNTVLQAFPFQYQGKPRLVPEPDPVLIYFHTAYMSYRLIDQKKTEILKKLINPTMNEVMMNELYDYFGLTSGFIIF